MTTLRARRFVTPGGVIGPAEVVVDGDTIVEVRPASGAVDDVTLCPGFVDLQVNGIDNVDVATADGADWDRLDRLVATQGTTTWVPTLVTMTDDDYRQALARITAALARSPAVRPHIAGVHLEGPFLARAGAHDAALLRSPVDLDWLAGLPDAVRIVTLAAELPGAPEAIAALVERGVVVSVGHTEATADQAGAAIDAGARLVTHLFNAMPPLGARAPGVAGTALADDRVVVGLIADGIHVDPRLLRLAFRAKGAAGVALVTDAAAWRAGRLGGRAVDLVDGAPRLADGTLAGSALTMDRAIAVCVAAGVSLADAVAAASTTPADLLGLTDRGRLAPGQRADLVALDADLRAVATWIGGVAVGPAMMTA